LSWVVHKTRAICLTTGIHFPLSALSANKFPVGEPVEHAIFVKRERRARPVAYLLFIGPGYGAVSGKTPEMGFKAFVSTA